MPQTIDPSALAQDKDFAAASPEDQIKYLSAQDPDFAKASREDQMGYLSHLKGPQTSKPAVAPPTAKQEQPGMMERADEKIENALAPNQQNYESAAKTNLIEAPKMLGRELYSGLKTIGGMIDPRTYYHAATDPQQQDEPVSFDLGQGTIPIVNKMAYRMLVKPVLNAVEDYSGGKVNVDNALSVAPEALGQGAGAVVGGKMMADIAPKVIPKMSELGESAPMKGAGRIAKTGAKVLANQSLLDKPFKSISKIPEYWRETSPEGEILSATKRAVREGRAAKIPVRVRMNQLGSTGEPSASSESPTFVREPRPNFTGENEGYMASVPRPDLDVLAKMGKPGAATQLQQLGKPIIYIPKEADWTDYVKK